MDSYFHLTASFWRSDDGKLWSCTLHPFPKTDEAEPDVRFHGTGDVDFSDVHNMSGTLRSLWTNMVIHRAGVQMELF